MAGQILSPVPFLQTTEQLALSPPVGTEEPKPDILGTKPLAEEGRAGNGMVR